MCVKNAEDNIKDTLMSVISQKYPHNFVSIIIVDGYSEDNTICIISDVLSGHDRDYKILYEREGLGKARQIALDNSSGDYLIWVDSDIILNYDYLDELVNFMDNNPDYAIASGRFTLWNSKNLISFLDSILWVAGDYRKRLMSNTTPRRNCVAGSIYRIKAIIPAAKACKKILGFPVIPVNLHALILL